MKNIFAQYTIVLFISTLLAPSSLMAQLPAKMGYIYPAGGKRGTTFSLFIGGQQLKKIKDVHISGTGVSANVIGHSNDLTRLQGGSKKMLTTMMKKVRDKRLAEFDGSSDKSEKLDLSEFIKEELEKQDEPTRKRTNMMLKHPILNDLENKSLRELTHMMGVVFFPKKMQQVNRQLSEVLEVEVTIDDNAQLGDREIRLFGKGIITSPMKFQIGSHNEFLENEPNNKAAFQSMTQVLKLNRGKKLPKDTALDLPIVINGQIMPGDIDRFRFKAKGGEKLVISAEARSLIPFLADAVPGWFQATMALYDSKGKKIAFADDFQFHPDPVFYFEIPNAGEYELEIRDSIYRGREDFVYRITVGETPFITSVFPLGAEQGKEVRAAINGWNLPAGKLTLGAQQGETVRQAHLNYDKGITNAVSYMVDPLPAVQEVVTSTAPVNIQNVTIPVIIDGNICDSLDKDTYSFRAEEGDKITLEVYARRLNSPLDSLVRIMDSTGAVLAVNDDHVLKDSHLHKDTLGIVTHHADSYLTTDIPKDGTYYVEIVDSRRHGSIAHNYRLRISEPRPDFALRATPSSISMRPGSIVPVDIHVLRKDGFDGEVKLSFAESSGITIHQPVIPSGCSKFTTTIRGPKKGSKTPLTISLSGAAVHQGKQIVREAVPADDTMQAFLFRHLVPAQEFMATVPPQNWSMPDITIKAEQDVNGIKAGDTIKFTAATNRKLKFKELGLKLRNAPDGVTVSPKALKGKSLEFEVTVDDKAELNLSTNLIIEVLREELTKDREGKLQKKRINSLGFLPAIPICFVHEVKDTAALSK